MNMFLAWVLQDGSRVAGFLEGDELRSYVFEDVRTAYDAVLRGKRVSNDGPILGYREKLADGYGPYKWISYNLVSKI